MTAIHTALSGDVPFELFEVTTDSEWQAKELFEKHQADRELQRQLREMSGRSGR